MGRADQQWGKRDLQRGGRGGDRRLVRLGRGETVVGASGGGLAMVVSAKGEEGEDEGDGERGGRKRQRLLLMAGRKRMAANGWRRGWWSDGTKRDGNSSCWGRRRRFVQGRKRTSAFAVGAGDGGSGRGGRGDEVGRGGRWLAAAVVGAGEEGDNNDGGWRRGQRRRGKEGRLAAAMVGAGAEGDNSDGGWRRGRRWKLGQRVVAALIESEEGGSCRGKERSWRRQWLLLEKKGRRLLLGKKKMS